MRVLETRDENLKVIEIFRARLEKIAFKSEGMEWAFPNGDRAIHPTYSISTHLGDIQVGVPSSRDEKVTHYIRFANMEGAISPDVEINIPLEHNRKFSGLYAQSGREYWLCSRGSFTSFRGSIKREFTFPYFDKWLVSVLDKDKTAKVIPVCSLASPTIADDIATFVAAVQELKGRYKDTDNKNEPVASIVPPANIHGWREGEEFEGLKIVGERQEVVYEYLHGPLCNQLKSFLEKLTESNPTLIVSKNTHVDVALVDKVSDMAEAIFEVKTSALPSDQIYSAVGQLLYYRFRYGGEHTKLYLVLPKSCKSIQTEEFIGTLDITLLYGESGEFNFVNGTRFVDA